MRRLSLVFVSILVVMIAITARASLERSVFEAGADLWPDWWFRATLADAYAGFITVYAWVWYRERSLVVRLVWGVLFAALGTMAISAYILRAIVRLPAGASTERLLLGEP